MLNYAKKIFHLHLNSCKISAKKTLSDNRKHTLTIKASFKQSAIVVLTQEVICKTPVSLMVLAVHSTG